MKAISGQGLNVDEFRSIEPSSRITVTSTEGPSGTQANDDRSSTVRPDEVGSRPRSVTLREGRISWRSTAGVCKPCVAHPDPKGSPATSFRLLAPRVRGPSSGQVIRFTMKRESAYSQHTSNESAPNVPGFLRGFGLISGFSVQKND